MFFDTGEEADPIEFASDVQVGKPYGPLPKAAWSGHTFLGWYLTAEGEDSEPVTAETLVETAEDHTLYARWQETEGPEPEPEVFSASVVSGEDGDTLEIVYAPAGSLLIAARYLDGQLLSASLLTPEENGGASLALEGQWNLIKVMALDGASSVRPLCPALEVSVGVDP